jgi:mannose-6-phosphate isomerase-like protein (cupin superfamily)
VVKRQLTELSAFRLPNQTNRLALVFDPIQAQTPFTFGIEIFEPDHKTTPHTHAVGHELFFIMSGKGEAFCDEERFAVSEGDVVVFPPTAVHGIDSGPDSRMYCLELMLPNDMFAEFVRAGQPTGSLEDDDMCILVSQGCS